MNDKSAPSTNGITREVKILLVLAMLYVTIDLTANVLVYKIVKVGPISQPGGIIIYPLCFILGDIIAELYGYKIARFVAYFDIFCTFIFSITALLIIKLPSPVDWHFGAAYTQVLGDLLRINFSVLLGTLIGVTLNVYLITKWKMLVRGKYFWLRSVGSTAIGEGILLLISGTMVFYGKMPLSNLGLLLLGDYAIRLAYAAIGGIPANIMINICKAKINFELNQDNKVNFSNPFAKYKEAQRNTN